MNGEKPKAKKWDEIVVEEDDMIQMLQQQLIIHIAIRAEAQKNI